MSEETKSHTAAKVAKSEFESSSVDCKVNAFNILLNSLLPEVAR